MTYKEYLTDEINHLQEQINNAKASRNYFLKQASENEQFIEDRSKILEELKKLIGE